MDMFDFAGMLFGGSRTAPQGRSVTATGAASSADGVARIRLDADVTPAEGVDEDGDQTIIDLPTSPDVADGDEVIVTLVGDGPLKTPVVTANPGSGDRMRTLVNAAQTVADAAQEVAEAVNQHFFADTSGIHVTEATQEDWDESHTGANVLINSVGQLFRDGLNNLLTLTTQNGARALTIWDGLGNTASNILARFSSDGISFADGTSFDIGDSSSYIHFDGNGHINIGGSGLTIGGYIPTGGVTVSDLTQAAQDATLNSNLQVGGRNLALDSKLMSHNAVASAPYAGMYSTAPKVARSDGFVAIAPKQGGNWTGLVVYMDSLGLAVGDLVAFSCLYEYQGCNANLHFYAMSVNSSGTRTYPTFDLRGSNGYDGNYHSVTQLATISSSNQSGKVWIVAEWSQAAQDTIDAGGHVRFTFQVSNTTEVTSGGSVHLYATKLERGNVATDWTAAPEDVDSAISNAAKTATSYVTDITGGGIMVHPSTDQTTGVRVTSDVDILRSGTSVANYGTTARIGTSAGKHVSIDSDSVDLMDGNASLATFGADETHLGLGGDGALYLARDKFRIHSRNWTDGVTDQQSTELETKLAMSDNAQQYSTAYIHLDHSLKDGIYDPAEADSRANATIGASCTVGNTSSSISVGATASGSSIMLSADTLTLDCSVSHVTEEITVYDLGNINEHTVTSNGACATASLVYFTLWQNLASYQSRVIGTLPVGYRPPTTVMVSPYCDSANHAGRCFVAFQADGDIRLYNVSGSTVDTGTRFTATATYVL